jgi:hypothetical protein
MSVQRDLEAPLLLHGDGSSDIVLALPASRLGSDERVSSFGY